MRKEGVETWPAKVRTLKIHVQVPVVAVGLPVRSQDTVVELRGMHVSWSWSDMTRV